MIAEQVEKESVKKADGKEPTRQLDEDPAMNGEAEISAEYY